MKPLTKYKSWILLVIIIFLISIQNQGGWGIWFAGLNAIDNLTYNPEINDLTYYNDFKQEAYSYDLDKNSWDNTDWFDQADLNTNRSFIYSFEYIRIKSINITIINNGKTFSNNFSIYFEETNSGHNASVNVFDFEKLYYHNQIIYVLHQDRPETSIHSDDDIFYYITRISIHDYENGTFQLSYYTMDFFDHIIPGDYERGNAGSPSLFFTLNGLIYYTIPAMYSFNCNDTMATDIIIYRFPKGIRYTPSITFHKDSPSMLIRYRIDELNVTLQYFRFYNDIIVREEQWEYSVFVHCALGPQVFINETTVAISDYKDIMINTGTGKPATPGTRYLTNKDGELRGTTWLYLFNLETGTVEEIDIPDYITRDGYQSSVLFVLYLDWMLPAITGVLILFYMIERIVKLIKFIHRRKQLHNQELLKDSGIVD